MAVDKRSLDGKETTQRRVYVLPTELVERIVEFQKEMGLSSEVEAARRLLDEALKRRDDLLSLVGRVVGRLKEIRSLRDAARDVLVDHPLVEAVGFDIPKVLSFRMIDQRRAEVSLKGEAMLFDEQNDLIAYGPPHPEWLAERNRSHPPKQPQPSRLSDVIDDDIPF